MTFIPLSLFLYAINSSVCYSIIAQIPTNQHSQAIAIKAPSSNNSHMEGQITSPPSLAPSGLSYIQPAQKDLTEKLYTQNAAERKLIKTQTLILNYAHQIKEKELTLNELFNARQKILADKDQVTSLEDKLKKQTLKIEQTQSELETLKLAYESAKFNFLNAQMMLNKSKSYTIAESSLLSSPSSTNALLPPSSLAMSSAESNKVVALAAYRSQEELLIKKINEYNQTMQEALNLKGEINTLSDNQTQAILHKNQKEIELVSKDLKLLKETKDKYEADILETKTQLQAMSSEIKELTQNSAIQAEAQEKIKPENNSPTSHITSKSDSDLGQRQADFIIKPSELSSQNERQKNLYTMFGAPLQSSPPTLSSSSFKEFQSVVNKDDLITMHQSTQEDTKKNKSHTQPDIAINSHTLENTPEYEAAITSSHTLRGSQPSVITPIESDIKITPGLQISNINQNTLPPYGHQLNQQEINAQSNSMFFEHTQQILENLEILQQWKLSLLIPSF